ncbi:MAG: carboxypeptidase-like regulatory domain-containing protein [Terracidiphilus sp.]|nr:carboxypeptidase-like regulatory domain-containing protein [Terracidiphilus sp.]
MMASLFVFQTRSVAQSGAGSIQGTISDPTGAVIPGASIHVVNQATGVSLDTKSNGVGFFQVPSLFTGTYSMTVTAPRMKAYKRTLELLVGQTAVINAVLATGEVTQQVEVQADTVQLTTVDTGTVSSTLENDRINQLPMNGRNILTLTGETTPGLESSGPNGLLGQAMEYVADGASLSNREFGTNGSQLMPDPDSVQEVHVEVTGSSAQYATPATGVLATKSGTNQVHGSFFETARNSGFGIARSRSNPSDFVAPPYIRNEFGASAGGPIMISHLYDGKNKSFWFFAYERYSLRSYSYENMKVPTAAMRSGDFSGLINGSNVLQVLYDPNTTYSSNNCPATGKANPYCRTAFTNNQIDVQRRAPLAKIFNDITALPSNSNNPLVKANLAGKDINNITDPTTTFRLDHTFNENNRAYLRLTTSLTSHTYNRDDPSNAEPTLAVDGLPYGASNISQVANTTYASAMGFTHVFSPTFYSETILSQSWYAADNGSGGTPNANFESQFGLPNNFGQGGFPQIADIISPISGTMFTYSMTQIISSLDENLTKTIGRHQLQFGGRYRHERFGSLPDRVKDSVSFKGGGTGLLDIKTISTKGYSKLNNTGYADADEFIGNATSYSNNLQPPYQHMHDMEFDAYFQDNYHLRKNLTFNLGLRYEAHPAIWAKDGIMEGFDLPNHAIVTSAPISQLIAKGYTTQAIITNDQNLGVIFETPKQAGMPEQLTRDNNFTWGPRFGFAWLPFGDRWGTVLRGAYGRYIYPEPIRNSLVSVGRSNPLINGFSMSYSNANYAPDGLNGYILRKGQTQSGPLTAGTPVMGINTASVIDSSSITSILPGIGNVSRDPDTHPNFVTQVNMTVEQPMKGNAALRVSYVYTHGQNLPQDYYFNSHPSTYVWELVNGIATPTGTAVLSNQNANTGTGPYDQMTYGGGMYQQRSSGWSNDNSLQVNYQRLFHHGIAYQISYAWSKPFRVGGNSSRDNQINAYQNYANSGLGIVTAYAPTVGSVLPVINPVLPPTLPSGTPSYGYFRALNRFANYMQDTSLPAQHIRFNGIVDLPMGRNKRFLGNANRFVDELIGGFQIAGSGGITSQHFAVTSTYWGPTNPLHIYKHKKPVTDCTSGTCYKAYEWFNGYIAPTALSGNVCSAGLSTVVSGLSSDWAPYAQPADQGCSAPQTNSKGVLAAVTDQYYGGSEVNMTLLNGTTIPVSYQPYPTAEDGSGIGSNPYSHTVLNGPYSWSADMSLFKVFPIAGRTAIRFNVDAFNVFNVQGETNPSSSTGLQQVAPGGVGASSKNTPRQIQLTLRLTF